MVVKKVCYIHFTNQYCRSISDKVRYKFVYFAESQIYYSVTIPDKFGYSKEQSH